MHAAWQEWEMTPPGPVLAFGIAGEEVPKVTIQLRPTFRKLAEKYYGDPSKRDAVKKGITRLHRQLGRKMTASHELAAALDKRLSDLIQLPE